MLHEEVKKYRELSGDTNPNTPISRIGGYLDGYEKALEQEPCEDAISRQAALDAIMGEPTDAHYPSWYARRIEDLPPVYTVPKTGHWIECDNGCGDIYYKCSVCNSSWCDALGNLWKEEMRYCPNCGAAMAESEGAE